MDKEVRYVDGDYQYLLGIKDGESYWLQQASWDCDWYWGLGYVELYHGKGKSDKSWRGHQHFDTMFLDTAGFVGGFVSFFDEQPFTEREIWNLLELMKSAYICRKYSDMLSTGGAHITSNPCASTITNKDEYDRINKTVIPKIMSEVYKLMTPNEKEEKR